MVKRYVYSGYILGSRLVFSEYLQPGFSSWTLSPKPPKCCRWVTDLCFATSIRGCGCSHNIYSAQSSMILLLLLSALNSVQILLSFMFMLLNTVFSVQPLQYCYYFCSALYSAQPTLSLTRYANLVYLGFRRSLAYLHLSAASSPNECHYWWEGCVFYLARV